MRHYTMLVSACEEIANNNKLPGRITDWACALYDQLVNREAKVLVNDLILLQWYCCDEEHGLSLINHALSLR